MNLNKFVLTPPIVAISAMIVAVPFAQGAAKTYDWTGAAGDGLFQSPGNWEPEYDPGVSDTLNYKIPASGEETVRLTSNLYSAYFNVSSDEGSTGRAVIDLDGNELWVTNGSKMTFSNPMPVVISNGTVRTWCRYKSAGSTTVSENASINTSGSKADITFDHVDFNFSKPASQITSADECYITCKDSTMSGYPYNSLKSNTHLVFDNTSYYVGGKKGLEISSGATNATIELVNGSVFSTDSGYTFGNDSGYRSNCRAYIAPCTKLSNPMYFCASPNGAHSCAVFTNATLSSTLKMSGTNNVVEFVGSTWHFSGSKSVPSVSGTGNIIRFGGEKSDVTVSYLDISGKDSGLEILDNLVYTNAATCGEVRFQKGSDGAFVKVGTNCILRMSNIANIAYENACTNSLVSVGRDSLLTWTGRGDVDTGAFGGEGSKVVLEGVLRDGTEGANPRNFYAGITMEFLGDGAAYENGYDTRTGAVTFGAPVSNYPDLTSTIRFVPGPNAFGGRPPFRTLNRGYSRILDGVCLEVDLRNYLPACGRGIKRIPLFLGTASSWVHFDLDKMNENLKVVTGNRLVRDARLVYNEDLNAIVLEFKPVFGMMILVR